MGSTGKLSLEKSGTSLNNEEGSQKEEGCGQGTGDGNSMELGRPYHAMVRHGDKDRRF